MNVNYIAYALMAVGVFTIYMALVHLFRGDAKQTRLRTAADAFYDREDEERVPPFALFCQGLLMLIGVNIKDQKPLAMLLAQAGLNSPHAVTYFLFFKRIIQPILLVVGAAFFMWALTRVGVSTMQKAAYLILASIFICIGVFGASMYVNNRKQKRQAKLLRSFPEALDLLLVCIESGLGLDAALSRVCAELHKAHPEVTQEFDRTRIELTVMSDRAQALQNLGQRTEIVPFKSLAAALIQTEKFGTSLLETLRVLSEDQRVNRLLRAENRAARIPVLITIPLIFCIMPSFMIIIMGPPIIRVIEQGGIMGKSGQPK